MIHTDGKPTIANLTTDRKKKTATKTTADKIADGFGPLLRTSAKREARGDRFA